jgi:hypothetical protein
MTVVAACPTPRPVLLLLLLLPSRWLVVVVLLLLLLLLLAMVLWGCSTCPAATGVRVAVIP